MEPRRVGREEALLLLQDGIGYVFRDPSLLDRALTHSSYAHESGLLLCNERLEYLGDAVLELVVSEALFLAHPDWDEGELTQERSSIVCGRSLVEWGSLVGLDRCLRLGRGLTMQDGRGRLSPLADGVEALLGAIYLDGGLEEARRVIHRLLWQRRAPSTLDPKSRLQQQLQAQGKDLPLYRTVAEEGPPHDRSFIVEVWLEGDLLGVGQGHSRKEGEFSAAEKALESLVQPVAPDLES